MCQRCNNRLQPTNDSISSNSRNRCGESTKYIERKVYKLRRGKGRKRAKSEKERKKRGMEIMRIAWGTCPKLLPCHYPEENRQPRAYYLYLDACKHVCKCSYTRERHVCTRLQGQLEKLLGIKEKRNLLQMSYCFASGFFSSCAVCSLESPTWNTKFLTIPRIFIIRSFRLLTFNVTFNANAFGRAMFFISHSAAISAMFVRTFKNTEIAYNRVIDVFERRYGKQFWSRKFVFSSFYFWVLSFW